ncbi:MAG TPA: thioesterase domain-containing protein [Xanthobacteraceae bacterium]|jgi:alpha-beta hydrolase superfamily lysophospholipase|nr:thioesterase domain-containing protein [Xanthobacteraceae bacterium]
MAGMRRFLAKAVLAGMMFLPIAAQSAIKPAQTDVSRPHVYLMRGLLNIFSLGMDQLATQIAQHGIEATVYNHSVEESVVGEIAQKYRAGDHGPYILVGHSLGADAVMTMAQQLNAAGVPVALVVPFDGTGSYTASSNVACVLNITQRYYAYMRPGAGFHGKLRNVDTSSDPNIDHLNIDKSPRLQALAMDAVLHAAHAQSCKPENAPAEAHAKDAPKHLSKEMPKEMPKPAPKLSTAPAPVEPTRSALTEPALRL